MSFDALLVTGGAGFIGQNAVHHLAAKTGFGKIVVFDALTYAANPTSLEPLVAAKRVEIVHGTICDLDRIAALFKEHKFDAVAHFAAESHVDRSIAGPDAFVQTNVIGTYNLLKCALHDWDARGVLDKARFLHVSTDEVFGDLEPEEPAFTESSPYKPSSPYSATKAASDHLVRAYHRTFGLPAVITNCSNNYGPYQHPEKLIPLMIIHALEGKPLPVYGDGRNVRDWLFVGDHCRALELALTKGKPGETYNIGGGTEQPNIAVVRRICDLIDDAFARNGALKARYPNSPAAGGRSCATLITHVTDRLGHDRRYAINPSYAKQALGYEPQQSFESGLSRTVSWYVENESWWRRALTPGFSEWVTTNYGGRDTIRRG